MEDTYTTNFYVNRALNVDCIHPLRCETHFTCSAIGGGRRIRHGVVYVRSYSTHISSVVDEGSTMASCECAHTAHIQRIHTAQYSIHKRQGPIPRHRGRPTKRPSLHCQNRHQQVYAPPHTCSRCLRRAHASSRHTAAPFIILSCRRNNSARSSGAITKST